VAAAAAAAAAAHRVLSPIPPRADHPERCTRGDSKRLSVAPRDDALFLVASSRPPTEVECDAAVT